MIYKNYTDLGIVSANKPVDPTRIVETETGTLYMIDSVDSDLLLKSTDKGDNWSTVYEDNGWEIECIFYDRTSKLLWTARNDGANHPKIRYFDTDDSDSATEMDTMTSGVAGSYTCLSIFRNTNKIYCLTAETQGGNLVYQLSKVDVDPLVSTSSHDTAAAGAAILRWTTPVTFATNTWCFVEDDDDSYNLNWIDGGLLVGVKNIPAGYTLTTVTNPSGISHNNRGAGAIFTHLYLVLTKTATGVEYLYDYTIGTNDYTELGQFDVILQPETNSDPDTPEKAFHVSEYKVYQFHKVNPQLYLIATPSLPGIIVAITDNFIIVVNNGTWEVWEYEDVSSYVLESTIVRGSRNAPSGSIQLLTYPITAGMFITIEDMFTTATVSASQIIFEGFVDDFEGDFPQTAILISPAQKDLDNEFPTGEYSGRTDEIIVSLIGDYCNYISVGVDSNGMAMGTIEFLGDKSLREIFDEFALQDNFIWYLTPTGQLYYNNGTVDSGVNFTATSPISNVRKTHGMRAINFVDIKGGFVSGAQISGTVAENLTDQQTNGRNPYEVTFSHLDLVAQCTTTNTNILARLGTQPLIIPFNHVDPAVGLIQESETVTFEYNLTNPNIPSDQFFILGSVYNARQGKVFYRISDQVI